MLRGAFIILAFYGAGELFSYWLNGVIPGSVLGMLLLFTALIAGWVKPDSIRSVVKALTENMALFFIPSTVGIMVFYPLILENWAPILTAIVVSTVVVMALVGLIQQKWQKQDEHID